MSLPEKEELAALILLLALIIALDFLGKLTPEALDGIKWVGMSFMASKGMSNLIPEHKRED